MSNPGITCCGDNDCGYWDGREGESIELKSDGYHVDATFTLPSNDAVEWTKPQTPVTFHLQQIIPESSAFPFSQDGYYWACVNWGEYHYKDNPEALHSSVQPGNAVRCFFAPPPGS